MATASPASPRAQMIKEDSALPPSRQIVAPQSSPKEVHGNGGGASKAWNSHLVESMAQN
jgi:hypothetical protein